MRVETDGMVLRQSAAVAGRKMIVLFTKEFGKISAGAPAAERGRNRSGLVLSPFTVCRYNLYRKGTSFSMTSAEVVKSYFSIGEDIDKYMAGSLVLEFTDKVLQEGEKAPAMYSLLVEFFEELSLRNSRYETLVLAYQVKVLRILGLMPGLDTCVNCSSSEEPAAFSIADGGVICRSCYEEEYKQDNSGLIYKLDFDIVNILKFFIKHPLKDLRRLALKGEMLEGVTEIIRKFISCHLDINSLKSEGIKLD